MQSTVDLLTKVIECLVKGETGVLENLLSSQDIKFKVISFNYEESNADDRLFRVPKQIAC